MPLLNVNDPYFIGAISNIIAQFRSWSSIQVVEPSLSYYKPIRSLKSLIGQMCLIESLDHYRKWVCFPRLKSSPPTHGRVVMYARHAQVKRAQCMGGETPATLIKRGSVIPVCTLTFIWGGGCTCLHTSKPQPHFYAYIRGELTP